MQETVLRDKSDMCWAVNIQFLRPVNLFTARLFHAIFSHTMFFSWNFPFLGIDIFSWNFQFHGKKYPEICFREIFFMKFSFLEKKSWKIPAVEFVL